MGTSTMRTTVSSPPWEGSNATENTHRLITSPSATSGKPIAAVSFLQGQNPAYWVARSATRRSRQTSPLAARLEKWKDKEYRHGYMVASIEQGVAWQIKVNREVRGLSQGDLASLLGTGQSAISRLEDPTYGAYSIDTLVKIADSFDCALSVRFVPYSELARQSADLSPEALIAEPFTVEAAVLEDDNG